MRAHREVPGRVPGNGHREAGDVAARGRYANAKYRATAYPTPTTYSGPKICLL